MWTVYQRHWICLYKHTDTQTHRHTHTHNWNLNLRFTLYISFIFKTKQIIKTGHKHTYTHTHTHENPPIKSFINCLPPKLLMMMRRRRTLLPETAWRIGPGWRLTSAGDCQAMNACVKQRSQEWWRVHHAWVPGREAWNTSACLLWSGCSCQPVRLFTENVHWLPICVCTGRGCF